MLITNTLAECDLCWGNVYEQSHEKCCFGWLFKWNSLEPSLRFTNTILYTCPTSTQPLHMRFVTHPLPPSPTFPPPIITNVNQENKNKPRLSRPAWLPRDSLFPTWSCTEEPPDSTSQQQQSRDPSVTLLLDWRANDWHQQQQDFNLPFLPESPLRSRPHQSNIIKLHCSYNFL